MKRHATALLLAGTLLMTAVDIVIAARYGTDPPERYVADIGVAVAWAGAGLVATRLRPGNRTGVLMLRLGFILALNSTDGDHLAGGSRLVTVVLTVATTAVPIQWPAGIHAVLAFPSGRLPGRASVLLVRTAYVWSLLVPVVYRIGRLEPVCPTCAGPAGLDLLPRVVDDRMVRVDSVLVIILLAVSVAVYGHRFVTASRRQRRILVFPTVGVLLTVAFAVTLLGLTVQDPVRRFGDLTLYVSLTIATVAAIPAGFLVGLLRERLDQARVSDLVAQLAVTPVEMLGPRLAQTLGDPGARLVFATPDGYLDPDGHPVPDGPHTRLTPVGDTAGPHAYLLHDGSLDAQPELVASVTAAAGLALDNARLRADLLAQLAEVRASRERLVEAGDTARRRLERDLHDGAQQQLIALGMSLRLIRQRMADAEPQTLVLLEETEKQTRAAIQELRDLARGIHPAILSNQGLAAAVEQLADRCPVPVRLDVDPLPPLPDAVAVTAYYVASEALANIAKHAAATEASIRVTVAPHGIGVQVRDDGVGGAHPYPGSGLAGLADRVAAVGGTLAIEGAPGGGTRLEAHIPIVEPG